MQRQESPWGTLLLGLGMTLMGAIICVGAIPELSQDDEAATAQPLRSRSTPPPQEQEGATPSTRVAGGLILFIVGAGFALYGSSQRVRQEELRDTGITVQGRVTRVQDRFDDTDVTYRFEDAQGEVREGIYTYQQSSWSDGFTEGQPITVIYDPKDSRRHMLDFRKKRRARSTRRP